MKKTEVLIIDDPDHAATAALRGALGMNAGTDHGAVIRDLTAAETAKLGPFEVRAVDMGRAMVELGRNEPAPEAPPSHFHVEADLSLAELRALAYARAALKPRTQVAKDAIAAITRLLGSKVAL